MKRKLVKISYLFLLGMFVAAQLPFTQYHVNDTESLRAMILNVKKIQDNAIQDTDFQDIFRKAISSMYSLAGLETKIIKYSTNKTDDNCVILVSAKQPFLKIPPFIQPKFSRLVYGLEDHYFSNFISHLKTPEVPPPISS